MWGDNAGLKRLRFGRFQRDLDTPRGLDALKLSSFQPALCFTIETFGL